MSLYLKYRPRDFESLVWQKFIKQTLKNALQSDKLVWAYLFTWPRGTGKTSTARILALGMNCLNDTKKPCFHCTICKSFLDNQLLDIIEIDAASNTGVDNIREIIERAQFVPNQTRFKVYIIDEVHMLSKGAFNALLKILEEPPVHVKFILATTEIHKVPETILSRCQRYDFKSIGEDDIKERLLFIAKEEGIEIDDKALHYIVKNARWGLRNAINLFEQLIIGDRISYEYIIENLWITGDETVENFLQKLLTKDTSVIDDYEELIKSGKNIRLFFKDLFYKTKEKIIEELKKWDEIHSITEVIEILDDTFMKSKNAFDEQITFLSGILRILQEKGKYYKKEEPITPEKTIPKKEEWATKEPERHSHSITENDVLDVFWEEVFPQEKEEQINISSQTFKKDIYIQNLKEKGMKGSIIISLKWATFSESNGEIKVKLASSIALKSLELEKNIGIYHEALHNIWAQNSKLHFYS